MPINMISESLKLAQYSSFILYTNYMVATDQAEQNFLTFYKNFPDFSKSNS